MLDLVVLPRISCTRSLCLPPSWPNESSSTTFPLGRHSWTFSLPSSLDISYQKKIHEKNLGSKSLCLPPSWPTESSSTTLHLGRHSWIFSLPSSLDISYHKLFQEKLLGGKDFIEFPSHTCEFPCIRSWYLSSF